MDIDYEQGITAHGNNIRIVQPADFVIFDQLLEKHGLGYRGDLSECAQNLWRQFEMRAKDCYFQNRQGVVAIKNGKKNNRKTFEEEISSQFCSFVTRLSLLYRDLASGRDFAFDWVRALIARKFELDDRTLIEKIGPDLGCRCKAEEVGLQKTIELIIRRSVQRRNRMHPIGGGVLELARGAFKAVYVRVFG